MRGSLGDVRIGGVLCNKVGYIKLMLSKSVGFINSNLIELHAIKEAFVIFVTSKWVIFSSFID